jgi:hypothetical protein
MLPAHGCTKHRFSFTQPACIKQPKKKKYGGCVSMQAAESDLHSKNKHQATGFVDKPKPSRQQTRDVQKCPSTKKRL